MGCWCRWVVGEGFVGALLGIGDIDKMRMLTAFL